MARAPRGHHRAVRAGVVAAVLDLQEKPGPVGEASYAPRRGLGRGKSPGYQRRYFLLLPIGKDGDVRPERREYLGGEVGVAAGNDDARPRPLAADAPHELARLVVAAVRHRTSVDDVIVRRLPKRDGPEARVLEARAHDFGLVLVELAAERFEGDGGHAGSGVNLPGEKPGNAGQEYADEYDDKADNPCRRPDDAEGLYFRRLAEPKTANQHHQPEQDYEEVLVFDHKLFPSKGVFYYYNKNLIDENEKIAAEPRAVGAAGTSSPSAR